MIRQLLLMLLKLLLLMLLLLMQLPMLLLLDLFEFWVCSSSSLFKSIFKKFIHIFTFYHHSP